jgi:tetratricopeptide (TPR) repeat protein
MLRKAEKPFFLPESGFSMTLDPYAFCPCGSGKKFKWCCQPIHAELDQAYQLFAAGQNEAALQTLERVQAQHPEHAEVYGRKAELLYELDRRAEAEAALEEAFRRYPDYPFGYFLRGQFAQAEGDVARARHWYREAARHYHPEAHTVLGPLYGALAECELRLNRPVAARAALEMALRHAPDLEECRQQWQHLFQKPSYLPEAARREYRFLSVAGTTPASQAAWRDALQRAATGKLTDARAAFQELTANYPEEAAVWYNLALTCAWLGENADALEALERYLALEADDERAAQAWALAEVLRCGAGLEDDADYVEYSAWFEVQQPEALAQLLEQWLHQRRFIPTRSQPDITLLGLLLEPAPIAASASGTTAPRLQAFLILVDNVLRLHHIDAQRLEQASAELQQQLGSALHGPQRQRGPVAFSDVLAEAAVFPLGAPSEEEARRRVTEGFQHYFEEQWIHKPLRSLQGVSPLDAVGHPLLRKKLRGLLLFLEQCAQASAQPYSFDRLRRKLGLLPPQPGNIPEDLSLLSAAELATLPLEQLNEEQLEQAYQAAVHLDAQELASHFARALIHRPPRSVPADRYPLFNRLIQKALEEGDTEQALAYIAQGQQADAQYNEGRRQRDYELRRGQVLTRRGELDQAREVFAGLIAQVPQELRYAASAAEAFLSAGQGQLALPFAEAGLAQARQQHDRDLEAHFQELVAAARKQSC